jgi:hypothetical protein
MSAVREMAVRIVGGGTWRGDDGKRQEDVLAGVLALNGGPPGARLEPR